MKRNQECLMTTWNLLAAALSLCLAPLAGGHAKAETGDDYRLSGPAVHGNLAIYFVHGKSRPGPIPLTLAEALAKKTIEVREIGQVNELQVENIGGEEIFIQAGDIVKGGQQDRVLRVSLVLKPHSGPLPIASFCVEQGRWSARGGEDVAKFSSANASLPSRTAKIEMAGTAELGAEGGLEECNRRRAGLGRGCGVRGDPHAASNTWIIKADWARQLPLPRMRCFGIHDELDLVPFLRRQILDEPAT
jgi:hypothetical protein